MQRVSFPFALSQYETPERRESWLCRSVFKEEKRKRRNADMVLGDADVEILAIDFFQK